MLDWAAKISAASSRKPAYPEEEGTLSQNTTSHPFLDPLWRRIALVGFCAAWSIYEWTNGEAFWGTLTAGMTAYGAWSYLLNYEPSKKEE